jgi:ribosomal RNA assembly protein
LESGEYFINEKQRELKKKAEKRAAAKEKLTQKRADRAKEFEAPDEE